MQLANPNKFLPVHYDKPRGFEHDESFVFTDWGLRDVNAPELRRKKSNEYQLRRKSGVKRQYKNTSPEADALRKRRRELYHLRKAGVNSRFGRRQFSIDRDIEVKKFYDLLDMPMSEKVKRVAQQFDLSIAGARNIIKRINNEKSIRKEGLSCNTVDCAIAEATF